MQTLKPPMLLFLLLLAIAGPAHARPADDLEAQIERSMRWYRALSLSASQDDQLRAILRARLEARAEHERARKARQEAEHAQIEALLTPDQKTRYQRRTRRGPYRPYPYTRGLSSLRAVGLDVVALRGTLTLTTAQFEQVVAALEPVGQALLKQLAEARKRPRAEYVTAWRTAYKAARDAGRAAVSPLLVEGQVPRFAELNRTRDALYAQREAQRKAWMTRRAAARTKPPGARAATPSVRPLDRTATAMAALRVDAEEAAVLRPFVEAIVRHQQRTGRSLASLRAGLTRASADADGLARRVQQLRDERTRADAKRERLEAALRELLMPEQEARMMGLDILR